ncbi:ABC transporter substrate-binding protein [Muricoccus radiodurans]|uniref:ABC transporter substrate-binding protein n=1 Tax=Muricoccus radiodurans TaxID=2231721 RepID=UPI003CF9CB27
MARRRTLPALLALVLSAAGAVAQEARIGLQTETSSMDPHFALVGANQSAAQHVFDPLVGSDASLRPVPGLTSFRQVEPDLWEFTVRQGATFHDGSPVTAEDLRFSLERMPRVPNSPAPFLRLAAATATLEVVDSRTLRLRSHGPDPAIPLHAMTAYIVSARAAANASSADFNAGRAAIGSGPWRFVEWTPGNRLLLRRNDAFWGDRPAFERATLRPIPNDAGRLAALLSGDVDLIEAVPPGDAARLRGRAEVRVVSEGSSRLIYLGLDQANAVSPFVTAKDGRPLDRNPLQDRRVREALSLGINRAAIVERVLQGGGVPAAQLVPRGSVGHDPDLAAPAFDPDRARALLREAGYPDGFRITLHSPNNRYVEDDKTAQAVAQMWSRIGLDARVEVMPSNMFFTRAGRREFSAFLIGWGNTAGDAYPGLSQVVATFDSARGLGSLNRGRYSNPLFDAALERARPIADAAERDAALRAAQRIAFGQDFGILPLHFPLNIWATRAAFTYAAAQEEATLAHHLRPAAR